MGFTWVQSAPRRVVAKILLFIGVGSCALPISASAQTPLLELEKSFIRLYQEKADAVVRVKVASSSVAQDGSENKALTVFSGFFISDDGKVLSNALPNENVTRIWIEKDGLSFLAEAIASDERANVSLLQTLSLPERFSYVTLPEAPSPTPIGSIAFAVTSPLDFSPSPAWGFVSGYESSFSDITFPFTYTRVGIRIGPAEGGSPVFDASGRLLGITVATLPDINAAYIVPTRPLRRIVDDLASKRSVTYATLNMTFDERHDPEEGRRKVVIESVAPESPAALGGIRPGDELVSLNDQDVQSVDEVRDLIFFSKTGVFLPIVIRRGDQLLDFALMLELLEANQAAN